MAYLTAHRRVTAPAQDPRIAGGTLPASESSMAGPARVLVVEDDPDVRDLMTVILSDAGYAVSTAGDGEEALRVAAETPPDAVVLDLLLPGATG